MNWFLCVVKEGFFLKGDYTNPYVRPGKGVGQCDLGPGIMDMKNGILYVVPGKFVDQRFIKRKNNSTYEAELIERLILSYYGCRA